MGSSGAKLREAQGELGGREGEAGGVRLLLPMGFCAFVGELYPDVAANLMRWRYSTCSPLGLVAIWSPSRFRSTSLVSRGSVI